MAIKEVQSEDEIFQEEPVKVKVRTKVKGISSRLVLQEDTDDDDSEVEHSGVTTDEGIKVYDQSRVAGGRIVKVNPRTKQLTYVNAKGEEINEETGEVINPEKYKEDYTLGQ